VYLAVSPCPVWLGVCEQGGCYAEGCRIAVFKVAKSPRQARLSWQSRSSVALTEEMKKLPSDLFLRAERIDEFDLWVTHPSLSPVGLRSK
jgi:hypothetical protein